MTPRDHLLFQRYPLAGESAISVGSVPTPYHVYDGHGLFIGGTADLAAARELLAPEQVRPVQTTGGRALMGVWVFDFTDASLGAHHELQFSVFASDRPQAPIDGHPLSLIDVMLTRPDVQMLCHGLWNSTPRAVAYNRELLGLNARVSDSRIERDDRTIHFSVDDRQSGTPVLEGRIHRPQRASWRANLALLRRLGWPRLSALAKLPWLGMQILNPVGEVLDRNAVAQSFTKAEVSAIRYFDRARDRLVFGEPRYRRLRFEPQFSQYMAGFKFVYLSPQ